MADDAVLLTLDRPHGAVRYRVLGEAGAPWLVVCHGLGGDHREFLPIAEALSDRRRVLLWDLPGHGESAAPDEVSIETLADAMVDLLDALEVERPIVLGFSLGGVVAQAAGRRDPDRFAGLIAYACFAPGLQAPLMPAWLAEAVVRFAVRPVGWETLKTRFAERCALTPEARTVVRDTADRLGKERFVAMTRALLLSFRRARSFRLSGPVVVLRGAADSNGAALDAAGRALAAAHPGTRTLIAPDAGHAVHLDRPEVFLALVRQALSICSANA